ncbi:MAG: hypothetical protein IJ409_03870 [Lachnospiraceae bacterium]|nr:hypothetical protein [Lachnospiraceae bacterium]
MKNKSTSNFGLKLASVLGAVLLWLVVTSIDNPVKSQSYYNIPVKLLNTALITDSGQVYEVLENSDVIPKVTIRAPHSVLSSISASNIIATADVSKLSSLDTITINLTTDVYTNDIASITGSTDTVKLNIENKRSKALSLKANVTGEVAEGYIVGDVTTDQNLVRITGPESVIGQVAKASVDVDVTGFTSDINTNMEVKLYDAEGHIVSNENLTQNIKNVGVKVSIWQTAEIPVTFDYTGYADAGYAATGQIEATASTVIVAGKSSALKNITEIEVPAEAIDITDATENYVKEIDIRSYLPDNVFLADSSQAKIGVTVFVEEKVSKRLELRGETVSITNLPEGYDASITGLEETFIIEVVGLSQDLAAVQAANITGRVDILEWAASQGMEEPVEGFYTVEVDFGLPDDVDLADPVTVVLHISKMEE